MNETRFIIPFRENRRVFSSADESELTLMLADRYWTCSECEMVHDRDINAAKNIRNFALIARDIGLGQPESKPVETSMHEVESMKQEACCSLDNRQFTFDISEDNGFRHKIFKFPAGEVSVKITSDFYCPEEGLTAVIIAKGADSDMIFKIMLMKEALERKGFNKFILKLPYLPYARQDRVCNEGEAFSLKVFCNLINSMNFSEVVVLDAHSDVGPALLNNCTNVDPYNHILDSIYEICGISDTEKLNIVSPDAGANKKCNKIYSKLIHQFSDMPLNVIGDLVKCDKTRDVTTGQLSGFEVFADDLKGHDCLIVDDICDGGGTFLGLADELKKKNAGKLYLYVSHGIFSKGIDILLEKFDMIFTTSSYQTQPDHLKLKVIG